MRTFSLFVFVLVLTHTAFALDNGTFNSLYYRYVPGDGIGTGTFVRAYWERQYLLTVSGNSYRLEESHCTHQGQRDANAEYYVEDGYFSEHRSGLFTKEVKFYGEDGHLRRTCTVNDASAQPSVNEAFSMECGEDWRWSFEESSVVSGYDYCKPWPLD